MGNKYRKPIVKPRTALVEVLRRKRAEAEAEQREFYERISRVEPFLYEMEPEDARHLFQELNERADTHGPEERKLYVALYKWWHS